jgi:predicted nuclease with RNAse H fold
VLTVGVDLATQPRKTGMAVLRWSAGRAVAESVLVGATDDDIVDLCLSADRVGIDAPFGWPEPFVEFLDAHRRDALQPFSYGQVSPSLALRATDRFVEGTFALRPLSVSTDRIGLTAIRASIIQARLRDAGQPALRDGTGRVVEVYPAVALKRWGLAAGSYKGAHASALSALVDRLQVAAPWLDLGDYAGLCRTSDDAFDALVSAMVARAHVLGQWHRPPHDVADRAAIEGWIVVPDGRLADLADAADGAS